MHGVQSLAQIRSVLEEYARRGVFRSYIEIDAGRKVKFRFCWLWNASFCMSFDPVAKSISYEHLLTGVPPGSDLESGIKSFVKEYRSTDRVEHRALDPQRAAASCSNCAGKMSLRVRVKDGDYAYAVNRSVNLVNELLLSHLGRLHPEYLAKQYSIAED